MKFIQIESTWINVSNVTHFEFTPSVKTQIGGKPAELAIEVVGNNPLRFFGADAETGYNKLTALIG
ncbi:MAG TPA: hypothetical protein VGH42_14555 [Verrucomicrobiae bacterium]|jgi:hypothetical protein